MPSGTTWHNRLLILGFTTILHNSRRLGFEQFAKYTPQVPTVPTVHNRHSDSLATRQSAIRYRPHDS
eukprot:5835343-Prymnesium_polylepis.2